MKYRVEPIQLSILPSNDRIKHVTIDNNEYVAIKNGKHYICYPIADVNFKMVVSDGRKFAVLRDSLYAGVEIDRIKEYLIAIVYSNRIGVPIAFRSGIYLGIFKDGYILTQIPIASKNTKEFDFDYNTYKVEIMNRINVIDQLMQLTSIRNIERNRMDLHALLHRLQSRKKDDTNKRKDNTNEIDIVSDQEQHYIEHEQESELL